MYIYLQSWPMARHIFDLHALPSGVAVGSGWQSVVAFVNIGSYYLVGVPLGVLFGWLQFGITVSKAIVSQVFDKRIFSFVNRQYY